jgi:hypothetical protein
MHRIAAKRAADVSVGSKAENLQLSICFPLFTQQRTFLRTAALRQKRTIPSSQLVTYLRYWPSPRCGPSCFDGRADFSALEASPLREPSSASQDDESIGACPMTSRMALSSAEQQEPCLPDRPWRNNEPTKSFGNSLCISGFCCGS